MTPLQTYAEIKAQTPGTVLLFRMGDFCELFYEDAETAARVLGLTLTSRDKGSTNPVPMAGFPYHQLDTYLRRLIQAGYRAAVCEQCDPTSVPKPAMVQRVVTPPVEPDVEPFALQSPTRKGKPGKPTFGQDRERMRQQSLFVGADDLPGQQYLIDPFASQE